MRTIEHWLAAGTLVAGLAVVGAALPASGASTAIVVTSRSDASNGDISSAPALMADPGPDGISLGEAIEVTNSDPGSYEIRFDPSLEGRTIRVRRGGGLPALTGGHVTVDGDTDDDGRPDVTVASKPRKPLAWGMWVASSGNRLRALRLRGFYTGVQLESSPEPPLVTGRTFAGNVVAGVVMADVNEGIAIRSGFSSACPPAPRRCKTRNTWKQTTIKGNVIRVRRLRGAGDDPRGIRAFLTNVGDAFEQAEITHNEIRLSGRNLDTGISLQGGGDSKRARISDVLIARNEIGGSDGATAIDVTAGANRAQEATVEDVRVVGNRLEGLSGDRFNWAGIVVQAGSDSPEFAKGPPVRYLDDNVVRDVVIRGNSVSGDLEAPVGVQAAIGGGGRHNRIRNVRIVGNELRTTQPRIGVIAWTGNDRPYRDRHAADNRISGLAIKSNRIKIGRGRLARLAGSGAGAGGIVVMGNRTPGFENLVRDVRIARNRIKTAYVGIRVIGGLGRSSRRNRVVCVRAAKNRIVGARKEVSIRSNVDGARRNAARRGGC